MLKFIIDEEGLMSQSLFYWIIYSYVAELIINTQKELGLNPYFIGLSTLIVVPVHSWVYIKNVSILILLDYLLLYVNRKNNKTGLRIVSILILLDYLLL